MSHNSFGHLFRVTTWGESHGPAIGCVVDGCPPLIPLTETDIQGFMNKRKPGQSRFTTQRREPDEVKILSGVMVDEDGIQKRPGRRFRCLSKTPTSARRTIRRSRTGSVPAMPISPMTPNTASATIAAVDGPRRAKPPCALPPGPSHAKCCRA